MMIDGKYDCFENKGTLGGLGIRDTVVKVSTVGPFKRKDRM